MEFCPCHFCNSANVVVSGDAMAIWAQCDNCLARGPAIARERTDASRQVIASWNAGRRFGRIAVANIPPSISSRCAAVASRLQAMSEAVTKGDYGDVDGVAVIFRTRNSAGQIQATLSLHGVSDGDARAMLTAVTDAQRARAVAFLQQPKS